MEPKTPVDGRVERKKEETRQKIITTAVALFQAQGVDATTMEQIAAQADIAKGTLYNYFPDKEAILSAFFQRTFRERNPERIGKIKDLPGTRARMEFIFTRLIEGIQTHKEIYEKYTVYRMKKLASMQSEESVKSGFYVLIEEIIALGQASGEIRTDLPAFMVQDLFEFAYVEAVKQFYMDPDHFQAREAIGQCVDVFMKGAGR